MKVPKIVKIYATNFLVKAILFNVVLAFSIVAFYYKSDGMTPYAIVAIATLSLYALQFITSHLLWHKMTKQERAIFIFIRRYDANSGEVNNKEVGDWNQKDLNEIVNDSDAGLEVQMITNGAATFVNVFVGSKWFINLKRFKDSK